MTPDNNQRCFFSSKVAKISKLYSYETAQYIQQTISVLRSHAAFELRDQSVTNKLLYVLQNLTMKILEFNLFY